MKQVEKDRTRRRLVVVVVRDNELVPFLVVFALLSSLLSCDYLSRLVIKLAFDGRLTSPYYLDTSKHQWSRLCFFVAQRMNGHMFAACLCAHDK